MNKLVGWAKSNLVIVVSMAVAIIVLPVALFFSLQWNASIREQVEQNVSQVTSGLNQIEVEYEIPSLRPGEEGWSERMPPTAEMTRLVAERRREIVEQSEEARRAAIERNSAGKELLVEGLLPGPLDETVRTPLSSEMIEAWPRAHAELLASIGAGLPLPDPEVARRLQARQQQEIAARVRNRVDQNLSAEEQAEIRAILSELRLELYRSHAAGLRVYAEPSVFDALERVPPDGSIPSQSEYQRLFWDWQHTYWVHEDIVDAIAKAATRADGSPMSVLESPVKRVLSIDVPVMAYAEVDVQSSLSSEIQLDFSRAHTGRTSGNAFYDVREATVELLVDADRMQQVIDAINTTNFMTVVGLGLEKVDTRSDLARGFAYGSGDLAVATLRVETVWIRSWLEPLMPPDVRQALGLPEPAQDEDENAGAGDASDF